MMAGYRLVPFGGGAQAPVEDVTRLHTVLLPASPVALLGPRFMRGFYYRVLPWEGLILGAVAYVDERPAGFVAATSDANGFMRTALRRHWWPAAWAVGTSVLASPTSAAAVWQAWRVMRSRRRAEHEAAGEILSLGVLPAYRQPAFVRQHGLHIAADLLEMAVERLRCLGVRQIGAAVRADNTEAKLFYAGLGWNLHRAEVPGWGAASVEFVWRTAG